MKTLLTLLASLLFVTGYGQVIDIDSGDDTVYYDGDSYTGVIDIDGTVYYYMDQLTLPPVRYSNNPIGVTAGVLVRNVINAAGTYHEFEEQLVGVGGSFPWTITKRTSSDGMHFTQKSAALFSVGSAGRFDVNGQADPSVLYEGVGDWKMWYDAANTLGKWDSLGYATSTDGTTWTKYNSILGRDVTTGKFDSAFIHHPAVIKDNGIYYMYYTGSRNVTTNYKIGLATSTDGIHWTKYAGNPILTHGTAGTWNDEYIRPNRPFILNGIWYMLYWGYDGTNWSIGKATSTDGYTWVDHGKYMGNTGVGDLLNPNTLDVINENGLLKIWYSTITNAAVSTGLNFASIDIIQNTDIYGDEIDSVQKFTISATKCIGDSVLNGVNTNGWAANYIAFFKITVASEITPDAIKMYNYSTAKATATETVKMNIYSDVSGKPYSPVTNGATNQYDWCAIIGNEWNEFTFVSNPTLSTGSYWIGIWSTSTFKTSLKAGGANNCVGYAATYGTWPSELTIGALSAFNDFDVYLIKKRTDIWRATLTTEPTIVYFNGRSGNKQTAIGNVDSDKDWFWSGNILYIYSTLDPNVNYQIGVPQ